VSVKRWFRSPLALGLAFLGDALMPRGPGLNPGPGPASLQAALAAQGTVSGALLDLEGVVGTAVGTDGRGGYTVRVYLAEPRVVALPPRLSGVPVVVEVTGPFVALDDDDEGPPDPRSGFPRPVPIGVSTGHPDVSAGTIGARVTDGIRVFALSNNHVFAASNGGRAGDPLLQPGVADGGQDPDDQVGTLYDFEPLGFCGATCPLNVIDAAIALTTADDLATGTPEGGYGTPRTRTAEAELGMEVQKFGRTTGLTRGRITGIHATVDVSYRVGGARFENQVVISGRGFSAGGDSGSLIVTKGVLLGDRRPVGLLFAGSGVSTVANPIGEVLERFQVRVDGGGS
jgi:hypothetical protein